MIRVLLFVLCFVGYDNLIDDHADPDSVKAELIRYLEEDDFDKTVGFAEAAAKADTAMMMATTVGDHYLLGMTHEHFDVMPKEELKENIEVLKVATDDLKDKSFPGVKK